MASHYDGIHVAFLILGVLGWLLAPGFLQFCMIALALIHFTSVALALPHELAHAFVGWLCGFRIFKIQIGDWGECWGKLRIGHFVLEFNGLLHGGMIYGATKSSRFLKWKNMAFVAAGPGFHAIFLLLLSQVSPKALNSSVTAGALWIFFLANSYMLALSLYPHGVITKDQTVQSDGLSLWNLFWMPSQAFSVNAYYYYWLEASDRLERNQPDAALKACLEGVQRCPGNPALELMQAICLLQLDQLTDARDILMKLRESCIPDPAYEVYLFNAIAWTDLMLRDPSLQSEAFNFSEQAYSSMPWIPEFNGTRGSILVEHGEFKVGQTLLRKAYAENKNPENRAWNAVFLARAMAQQGQNTQAAEMWERAVKLAQNLDQINRWKPQFMPVQ